LNLKDFNIVSTYCFIVFYPEDAQVHILPSAATLDPVTELTAQLVSVVNGGYNGPSVASTATPVRGEASAFDRDSLHGRDSIIDRDSLYDTADSDTKIDTQLLKAMNEHGGAVPADFSRRPVA
jgi:hypothetical protein